MNIVFTGASSFTGFWFVRMLAQAGHTVHATLQRRPAQYEEVRKERVALLLKEQRVHLYPQTSFGSASFIELLHSQTKWDLFCHHAAEVTDYKSEQFDPVAALQNNTRGLQQVFACLKERSCRQMILTASVFEADAGLGLDSWRSISPYGLSKKMTSDLFCFYCERYEISLGKFVIPNPFGPYEEARFTRYLMHNWAAGKPALVHFPLYVRDNIPVELLARAYRHFVHTFAGKSGYHAYGPNGYVESQQAFTERFAKEMRHRLGWECAALFAKQIEFSQPAIRINCNPIERVALKWDAQAEEHAWDALAAFYKQRLLQGAAR